MTDQSRIEAVSQAIQRAASENLTYEQIAQAAIEANDDWFQGLGAFKAIYSCTSCGDEFEMTMATVQPCIQCKDGSRLLSIQEIKR